MYVFIFVEIKDLCIFLMKIMDTIGASVVVMKVFIFFSFFGNEMKIFIFLPLGCAAFMPAINRLIFGTL